MYLEAKFMNHVSVSYIFKKLLYRQGHNSFIYCPISKIEENKDIASIFFIVRLHSMFFFNIIMVKDAGFEVKKHIKGS